MKDGPLIACFGVKLTIISTSAPIDFSPSETRLMSATLPFVGVKKTSVPILAMPLAFLSCTSIMKLLVYLTTGGFLMKTIYISVLVFAAE